MATRDDDLRQLEDEGAAVALQAGADPGQLAAQLAGTQTAAMGAGMANRYAQMGARWLADPMPTRVDGQLLDRLMRQGFRRESLDNVRIHRGTKAQQAATALGARAFAIGDQDIFFGQGEFDPSSRSGRAVIAHELAHVAPPDLSGGNAPSLGGSIPTSFGGGSLGGMGAPLLNERKRGDEDAAGSEAHERQAREAERRVYAEEDGGQGSAQMASGPMEAGGEGGHGGEPAKMDPHALEAKVLAIIGKWERTEIERSGAF
jgi:hypothetical protein